jgi:hypothetical protein
MKTNWISLVFLISLALASCATPQPSKENPAPKEPRALQAQESPANTPENPVQLNSTPETADMPSNPPPVEKYVALTKRDLANRLKVEAENISLVQTTEITWPNTALGCPSPGKVYPQGLVPGYKIWLENSGVQYIYHTDYNGNIVLCPEQNDELVDPPNPATGSTQGPNIGVPID